MDNNKESESNEKYITILNNIVNDLHKLKSDLHGVYDMQQTQSAPSWKMYWSDDWLSSAGEDASVESETDTEDDKSPMTSSFNNYVRKDKMPPKIKKKMKPLPPIPTSPTRTPTTPQTPSSVHSAPPSTSPEVRPITNMERITKTHPVWFLPEMSRAGAVHLLKDKEPGTFIVRRSSQKDTWALSVHQSNQNQPTVDHYLIQASAKGYTLPGSHNTFTDIPSLIAHYCVHMDELPEMLTLPHAIRTATTTQQLVSLSLLGQDFWTMSKERVSAVSNTCNNSALKPVSGPQHIQTNVTTFYVPTTSPSTSPTKQFQKSKNFPKSSSQNQLSSQQNKNKVVKNNEDLCGQFKAKSSGQLDNKGLEYYYQSTSMDMLIPQDQYHSGRLSARMSDYSDVWQGGHSVFYSNNYSSNSSNEETYYDANSDVCSDSSIWSHQGSNASLHKPLRRMSLTQKGNKNKTSPVTNAEKVNKHFGSSSTVESSEERTPTVNSAVVFKYAESGGSGQKTVTPNSGSKSNKPPPTPPKLVKLSRLRSTSSPSVQIDQPKSKENFLDTNCNEIKKSSSLRLTNPQSSLWVRRWRSLPFRLKHIEAMESHGLSPFEAVSPRLRQMVIKKKWEIPPDDVVLRQNRDKNTPEQSKTDKSKVVKLKPVPVPRNHHTDAVRPKVINVKKNIDNPVVNLPSPSCNKFPIYSSQFSAGSDMGTVSDIITTVEPQLLVRNIKPLTEENMQFRASQYDNYSRQSRPVSLQTVNSVSSTATEYCKPWDSFWDSFSKPSVSRTSQFTDISTRSSLNTDNRLSVGSQMSISEPQRKLSQELNDRFLQCPLPLSKQKSNSSQKCSFKNLELKPPLIPIKRNEIISRKFSAESDWSTQSDDSVRKSDDAMKRSTRSVLSISMDATEEVIPVGLHVDNDEDDEIVDRNSVAMSNGVSSQMTLSQLGLASRDSVCNVRDYVLKISQDQNTTFGRAVENFVKCTLEGHEPSAHIVMRNVRQFMNGIKNYLVTSGEGDLDKVIDLERNKLQSNTILNIDAIIEGALHKCVLRPLKYHIYRLLVDHYRQNGDLRLMSVNVKYGRTLTPQQMGVPAGAPLLNRDTMDAIHFYLNRMQKAYSPLKKLEHFLSAVSAIYGTTRDSSSDSDKPKPSMVGADDFLPMLMYVLADCGLVSAEVEADYMSGLLHPSILTGEGGYYLTSLSSAVHSLKTLRLAISDKHFTKDTNKGDKGRGWMRVVIPDELSDKIVCRTLPVRPHISTKDVCTMLAHKLKITNPQDYGLFCLHQGEEINLKDLACPHSEHPLASVEDRIFTYKRRAAKIAWPKNFVFD